MKTPLYVSLCAIAVNIVMNFILMGPLKQGGIALATTISSVVNNLVLLIILFREGFAVSLKAFVSMFRSAVLALSAGYVSYLLFLKYGKTFAATSRTGSFTVLMALGIFFLILYFGTAFFCRTEECRELLKLLRFRRK